MPMLEFSCNCPKCNAPNGGIALAPFAWWYVLFGIKCWNCGIRFEAPKKNEEIPPSVS